MGDHGPRHSTYRHLKAAYTEDNNPALIIISPKKLPEKKLMQMKANAKRLLTGFDIYATLADIIDAKDVNIKGISLLQNIPNNRTCTSLKIAPQFCICERESHKLDPQSAIAQQLGDYIIGYMNDVLEDRREHCAVLRLDESVPLNVKQIMIPSTSEKVRAYKLTFRTLPGKGKFFVYLQVDDTSGVRKITNMSNYIYRMNSYKDQAWCAPKLHNLHQRLLRFCYCKME